MRGCLQLSANFGRKLVSSASGFRPQADLELTQIPEGQSVLTRGNLSGEFAIRYAPLSVGHVLVCAYVSRENVGTSLRIECGVVGLFVPRARFGPLLKIVLKKNRWILAVQVRSDSFGLTLQLC